MHLTQINGTLCEFALRIIQAISHTFEWCRVYGLHQEVPLECIIMDAVRQKLDNLAANYNLTSYESTKRCNLSKADLVTIVNLAVTYTTY